MRAECPTLWSYWDEGLDSAPELVQVCIASWFRFAPKATVVVLDKKSLFDFLEPEDLPLNFSDFTVQHQSDFIRLALLARYGGVWLDASVFLSQPLLPWLSEVTSESGFFLFRRPGPDREFSNWFISAAANDFFLVSLQRQLAQYFARPRIHRNDSRYNSGLGRLSIRGLRFLSRSSRLASLWTLQPLRSLRRYPYHIFHYLGNGLMKQKAFRAPFDGMTWISADEGHHISRVLARREKLTLSILSSRVCPVNKLKLRNRYSAEEMAVFWSLLT